MIIERHLSTEELLLQFDGEFDSPRAAHLDECEPCRCALVDLTTVLEQAEMELRASVPDEPPERHAASWGALEARLRSREKVKTFPLRWAAAYAAAAALGFFVISGSLTLEFFGTPTQSPAVEVADGTEPAPPPAPPNTNTEPKAVPVPEALEAAAIMEPAPAEAPLRQERAEQRVVQPPARFKLAAASDSPQAPARPALDGLSNPGVEFEQVQLRSAWVANVLSGLSSLPPPARPLQPEVRAIDELTPRAAEAVIAGHWVLYEAKVWREDIVPVWTEAGLVLRGSVEDDAAKARVLRAIKGTRDGRDAATDLRVRSQIPDPSPAAFASEQIEQRPSGGMVRNSLLAHFSDAARRSFVAPEPSVLQGEIDRLVSEVFRSQSELLAHVYELKSILGRVDSERAQELGPDTRKKLRELTGFHLSAVNEAQARIYDRLSETLPRKFWSHRASQRRTEPDWQSEVSALLGNTLELDSTLTALLSKPETTLDASQANLSCGSLLSRIRGRVRHLRAGAKELR